MTGKDAASVACKGVPVPRRGSVGENWSDWVIEAGDCDLDRKWSMPAWVCGSGSSGKVHF